MICEIICVAGFLCMSNLDIVHILSAYVHVICILSEHMRIMCILSAVVLDIFLPNPEFPGGVPSKWNSQALRS